MTYWLLFFSAALALNLAPGPDLIYVLSRTIAQGAKVGIASSLGVCAGAFVHVIAAALGLSAILATSALAFSVVKYIGAAYLIFLGIKALVSKGASFDIPDMATTQEHATTSTWDAFKQGMLVDILNPKVAIFFMAFLPQFVRSELGHTSAQIIGLGFLVILVAIVVETIFVFAAAHLTHIFRRNQYLATWLDRLLGSILITLGLKLAVAENPS
ncbi:MAG: LysE family translocator [Cyanobacteria bacterium P01_D01_bin.156]